jgi:hypothetical protein
MPRDVIKSPIFFDRENGNKMTVDVHIAMTQKLQEKFQEG